METEAYKTELFIDEIEKRPAIWNMISSIYSVINLRRRAWEELVLIICEGDDNEERKKLIIKRNAFYSILQMFKTPFNMNALNVTFVGEQTDKCDHILDQSKSELNGVPPTKDSGAMNGTNYV